MPKRSPTLHGNAPHSSTTVMLIIDMINDFSWSKGKELLPWAHDAAKAIRKLKTRAAKAQVPVIYVNDNFGQWRSNFAQHMEHCKKKGRDVAKIVELLAPEEKDYLILKPQHSAFYASPLELLLKHINVKHLVLTGLTTESCVLITAMEAFMRGFKISIPSDCVASSDHEKRDAALKQMIVSFHATVAPSTAIDFKNKKISKIS